MTVRRRSAWACRSAAWRATVHRGNHPVSSSVQHVMKISRHRARPRSLPVQPTVSGSECIRAVSVALVASVLVACGSAAQNEGSSGGVSSIPDSSIPTVDLSQRPVADAPDPSERAGAAANFIECEYGVWQGGWSLDFGPLGSGSDPDGAIDDLIRGDMLGLPGEDFTVVGQDQDRVLYTYEVADSPKASVVVADSEHVALDTEDRWAVETFATCDPAEFDPSTDDQFPMDVWQDTGGNRVPTSVITSSRGPEHCGWESATFLTLVGVGYISDPDGVLGADGFVAPFDDDAELPSDAIKTDYQRDGRRLWLSKDRTIAFVVSDDRVEAWPSSTEDFFCA